MADSDPQNDTSSRTAPSSPGPARSSRLRWLWWLIAGLLILAAIVLIATPFVIRWGIEKAMTEQGAPQARVQDVDFNPFTGVLVVKSFRADAQAAEKKLAAVELQVHVDWLPLWGKKIFIPEVTLRDVDLHLQRNEAGGWTIGELTLPVAAGSDDPPEEKTEEEKRENGHWGFGIGRITMEDVRIHYKDPRIIVETKIIEARTGPLETWKPEGTTPFALDMITNQGRVQLEGEARPLADQAAATAQLQVDGMPIAWLRPLLEELSVSHLSGQFDTDLKIDLKTNEETVQPQLSINGRVQLSTAGFKHPQAEVESLEFTWDGAIDLQVIPEDAPAEWNLEGDLQILAAPVRWNSAQNGLRAAVDLDLNHRISARQQADGRLSGRAEGPLDLENLLYQSTDIELQQGDVSWNGAISLERMTPEELPALTAEGDLELGDFALDLAESGYGLKQGEITADLQLALPAVEDLGQDLDLAATLTFDDTQIFTLANQRRLLQLEQLEMKDLKITGFNRIVAQAIRVNGLQALGRTKKGASDDHGGPDSILQTDRIEVVEPRITDLNSIHARDLQIENLGAWILRDSQGHLEARKVLSHSDESQIAESEENKGRDRDEAESSPRLALEHLMLAGNNHIVFIDQSVSPQVRKNFSKLTLEVTGLDSGVPSEAAEINAESRIGDHGILNLNGTLQPFGENLSSDLQLKLKNVNLSALDGYLREAIGYRFKSGRLDGEINGRVDEGTIDSNLDLIFAQLEVETLRTEDKTESTGELGVPLGKALDLVRDGDGTIHLDIPIEGNLNAPQFRIGKIVRTAFFQTLKKGMVSYYAPLGASLLTGAAVPAGALWAAGKLFDMATAIRFDPMVFEPGESTLNKQQQAKLEEMAQLLADRPGTKLVVCGIAAPEDLAALRAERAQSETVQEKSRKSSSDSPDSVTNQTPEETDSPPPPADKEEKQRLYELADRRSQTVQNRLIELGIQADRLLACSPDFQQRPEAQPRVELGI